MEGCMSIMRSHYVLVEEFKRRIDFVFIVVRDVAQDFTRALPSQELNVCAFSHIISQLSHLCHMSEQSEQCSKWLWEPQLAACSLASVTLTICFGVQKT